MFSVSEVHWFCDLAEHLALTFWVDGGWAVDALLGRQTRDHRDLDLALGVTDGRRLHDALVADGFTVQATGGRRPANYVLGRGATLIDLHLVEWDQDGNGLLARPGGGADVYPAAGFTGEGTIGRRAVRCIEPATLVSFHTGYAHDRDDQVDVLALCDRFGVEVPAQYHVGETFEELLAEAEAVPTAGWDFGWFGTLRHGRPRATEERPSWGYAGLLTDRVGRAEALLDLQTGGGEVLAEALTGAAARGRPPGVVRATESFAPNRRWAVNRLAPFGVLAEPADDAGPLPFGDGSFDLVAARHPTVDVWPEVARVLRPGGRDLGQHVGVASAHETSVAMLGPFEPSDARSPERAVHGAEAAGLRVVDLREARLRMEFFDVAALAVFLRKVVWMVPDFAVDGYRDRLAHVHQRIEAEGSFVAHSTRFLLEAVRDEVGPRRPGASPPRRAG